MVNTNQWANTFESTLVVLHSQLSRALRQHWDNLREQPTNGIRTFPKMVGIKRKGITVYRGRTKMAIRKTAKTVAGKLECKGHVCVSTRFHYHHERACRWNWLENVRVIRLTNAVTQITPFLSFYLIFEPQCNNLAARETSFRLAALEITSCAIFMKYRLKDAGAGAHLHWTRKI